MNYGLYVILLIFCMNALSFLIAWKWQTDKLTDFTYSASFIAVCILSLWYYPLYPKGIILCALVIFWAARLGYYLFSRVHRMSKDDRFDAMRPYFFRYGAFWLLQALSIFIIILPVTLFFYMGEKTTGPLSYGGTILAIAGFLIEAIADSQKNRAKKIFPGEFVSSGLYSFCRFPNYLGEILFWIGVFIVAQFIPGVFFFLALLSPIWIALLLIFISGIPLLEKKQMAAYGTDPRFLEYVKKTPRLWPNIY